MDDEWKLLISGATDEMRRLPAEKAAKEKKLEEDITQVEAIFSTTIIPALKELKEELDKQNTPASVTSRAGPFPEGTHYSASITIALSGVLRDFIKNKAPSARHPEFFYEIGIDAISGRINNQCHITDTRGQNHELSRTTGPLPTAIELARGSPDLTRDNIKLDFGLRYKDSVGSLRSAEVYGASVTLSNGITSCCAVIAQNLFKNHYMASR